MTRLDTILRFKLPRVCAESFVREEDLPPGQKLLLCGRCFETHYVDKAAQRRNWPVHKLSCCPVEKDKTLDIPGFDVNSVADHFQEMGKILSNPKRFCRGRGLLRCIQSFQHLLEEKPHLLMSQDTGDKFVPVFVQQYLENCDFGSAQILWAIPGFANYFSSDEIVLTTAIRNLKAVGPLSRIVWYGFYYRFMLMTLLACRQASLGCRPCAVLPRGILQIKMRNWRRHFAGNSTFHETAPELDRIHINALFSFVVAYNMKDDQATRSIQISTRRDFELVAGMTAKELLSTLLADTECFGVFSDEAGAGNEANFAEFCKVLLLADKLSTLEAGNSAWKKLTVQDRLELLDSSHEAESAEFLAPNGMRHNSKDVVLRLIKGVDSTSILLDMYRTALSMMEERIIDPRTVELLWISRELLLVRHRPKAAACLEEIRLMTNHEEFPSLPADVMDVIVEYALPESTLG